MKTIVRVSLVLALAAVLTTGLFANGLNLNGFGARATAMGGAYVSLANDVTAVFWNPAGLALIKQPTFGLAGDVLIPTSTYGLGEFEMETNKKYYPAGLLGYFQPVGDRIVVGVGVYTVSGLGTSWNNPGVEAALLGAMGLPPAYLTPAGIEAYKWESFVASISLSPSIAIRITDQILFGATLNVNYGFFKMDRWAGVMDLTAPDIYFNPGQQTLDVKGWGFGATFGLMIKPADWISFGATYRTASKMKMSGTTEMENLGVLGLETESPTDMEVVSPMWLAGGISIKPVPELTLSFDAHYTNWKKLDTIGLTFGDPYWAVALAGSQLELDWDNAVQLRAGAEYAFGNFAVRAGYYHDPAPAPAETLNILIPGFTYDSFAGGFGYKTGGLTIDFAFEYLKGKERIVMSGAMPGVYNMNILVPVVGISYAF